MTSNQQRAALQHQSWAIANDVRGAVGGWDFKQFFWQMVPRRVSSIILHKIFNYQCVARQFADQM
jgi:hypothetical protein